MTIEAAGGSGNRPDFKVGDRVVYDFKLGFEVGEADLLEEDAEFIFYFFGFVEEIELVSLVIRENAGN